MSTNFLHHTLTGHTGEVDSVAISPDGQWIASGSQDKSIRIWNCALSSLENESHSK